MAGLCGSERGKQANVLPLKAVINNVCAVFFYDINGDKKPNSLGKDIFLFAINADGVYPDDYDVCNKNSQGFGCAAYIIRNGNMNYLH